MAKNWIFSFVTGSSIITIVENSMAPTSSTIWAGPSGATEIAYSRNNTQDIAGHNYFIIRSGQSTFKVDYNGDTCSPATASNTVIQYISKLCNLLNTGSFS